MLYKLAARSFFRQSRGYLVYFFCMTLSVMIYYSFNAMTYDQALIQQSSQGLAIDNVLGFGNLLIISLLIFFIFSANRFFLNKRIKEFGIYQLFGVKKQQVAVIYCIGIAAISFISTCLGILLGIIFSKLFAMILVKMMHLQVSTPFFVSIPSIYGTIRLFFIIVSAVALHSFWKIWLLPMLPIFEARRQPFNKMRTIKKQNYFLGVLGVLLLLYGYYSAVQFREILTKIFREEMNPSFAFLYPLLILLCCVLGTYLFFSYTAKTLCYKISRQKSSYRGLRFIIVGNTRFHLLKGRRTNTLITVILGISLAMIGGVASLSTFIIQQGELFNPTSYQMTPETAKKVSTIFEKRGETKQELVMDYKMIGSLTNVNLANKNSTALHLVNVISEKEYQRFRKMVPNVPEVHLKSSNQTILLDEYHAFFRNFSIYGSTVYLPNQQQLKVQMVLPDYLGDSQLRYNNATLIVSDKIYQALPGTVYQVVYLNTDEKAEETLSEELNQKINVEWVDTAYYRYIVHGNNLQGDIKKSGTRSDTFSESNSGYVSRLNFVSHYETLRKNHLEAGIYLYVSLFVGMIVVIMTGSILMVRQLAEAEEEQETYILLTKLGIGRKEINQIIFKQNAVLFFPPMILGILHAVFAINIYTQYIKTADYWLAYLVCGLLVVVYIVQYYATSKIYCRIVES